MRSVAGIFTSVDSGARSLERVVPLVGRDNVTLLLPGESHVAKKVPATEDMAPVGGPIVAAIAGTLGAGLALAIPGVGAITAFGAAAAAALGTAAGYAGWQLGKAADLESYEGPSIDELYVYEDALERGRALVLALTDDADVAERIHGLFEECGAESIDAAREQWWVGIRDAEAEEYERDGGRFADDEVPYREGFVAALHPRAQGRGFEEVRRELASRRPAHVSHAAFQRGFERGQRFVSRRASAEASRETPPRQSSRVDEASMQSFPASDPPATAGSGRTGSPARPSARAPSSERDRKRSGSAR